MNSSSLLLLAGLAVVGIAAIALIEALVRRTPVGLGVVAVFTVYDVFIAGGPELGFGGINITMADIAFGLLLAATFLRYLRSRDRTQMQVLLMGFSTVLFLSVARGALAFGPPTAIHESRKYVYIISGVLYMTTAADDIDFRDLFAKFWVGLGTAMMAIAIMRWAANGVGVYGGIFGTGGTRTVDARSALLVGQAAVIGMLAGRTAPTWMQRATPALFVTTIFLQHRTIWVILIVTFAAVVVRDRALSRRVAGLVVGAAVVGAVLTFTLFSNPDVQLREELADSATSSDTFEWRLEGWKQLIDDQTESLSDVTVGRPFGAGFDRRINGQQVTFSPHNFVIETFLRTGIVGVVILGAWHLLLLRRLRHREHRDALLPDETLLILALGLLAYYVTYSPSGEQALLLGLLTVAADRHRRNVTGGAISTHVATVPRAAVEVGAG